jgi:hypothetical protein
MIHLSPPNTEIICFSQLHFFVNLSFSALAFFFSSFGLAIIVSTLATVASFGFSSAWQLSLLLWQLWLLLLFLPPGNYHLCFGNCGFFCFFFRLATIASALATVASFAFSSAWQLSPLLWQLWLLLLFLPPGNYHLCFGNCGFFCFFFRLATVVSTLATWPLYGLSSSKQFRLESCTINK